MRIRMLIVTVGLAFAALFALSSTASAVTAPAHPIPVPAGSTEQQKCIVEAYNNGTDVTDCYTAQSPIIPDTTDLVWGGAAFIILLLAMWKLALPSLRAGMNELLATYQRQVAESKSEATRIIEDARATADGLKADMARRAEAEIAEMRERAAHDVEASKAQAIADLTGEVASLAIGAAEVVVQRNLDRDTQVALVENYINQVGSAN
jgi:F-type H+-transporting ATPase subunit b